MRQNLSRNRRNGFVVVVVLCMVILLSVLLLGFNHKSRIGLRNTDDFQKSLQALNCARAGLNIAIAALRDSGSFTGKKWRDLISGDNTFAVGEGSCSITMTAESSKLNVNLLKGKNGTLDRTRTDQLLRLIDLLNREQAGGCRISYGLVPAIIDWTDYDEDVTCLEFVRYENLGAESDYYRKLAGPYGCKNLPLNTVDELLLVKGMSPEIFEHIRDCVTVYGDGKTDLNHAPKRVIMSLSEKMDPALAQMIISRRQVRPFEHIAELRDVPGMTDAVYDAIERAATIRSSDQHYRVTSRGIVGDASSAIVAVLRRNVKTGKVEVVFYQEC